MSRRALPRQLARRACELQAPQPLIIPKAAVAPGSTASSHRTGGIAQTGVVPARVKRDVGLALNTNFEFQRTTLAILSTSVEKNVFSLAKFIRRLAHGQGRVGGADLLRPNIRERA